MNNTLHTDFTQRIVVHSQQTPWLDSPMVGVKRRPLERYGQEIARATSIVQYAAGSQFSPHCHLGGEELYVLEGVFQDEHGDYPAGSYIRNPPHSSHTPFSTKGCRIFVKLWQIPDHDQRTVTLTPSTYPPATEHHGITEHLLYHAAYETVSLQIWPANKHISMAAPNGLELLVLSGQLHSEQDTLQQGSWLRLPCGATFTAYSQAAKTTIWLKQHHLNRVEQEIVRLRSHIS